MKNREDGRVRLVTQRSGDYIITSGQGNPAPVFLPYPGAVGDCRANIIRERITLALAQLTTGGKQVKLVLAQEWKYCESHLMIEISKLLAILREPNRSFWTPPNLRNEFAITIAVTELPEQEISADATAFENTILVAIETAASKELEVLRILLSTTEVRFNYDEILAAWDAATESLVGNLLAYERYRTPVREHIEHERKRHGI